MTTTFNPFTGNLDIVKKSKRNKQTQVVDAAFLLAPDIVLSGIPDTDSEVISLNGLEIDSTNYSIGGDTITMITTQLRAGDILYINFIS